MATNNINIVITVDATAAIGPVNALNVAIGNITVGSTKAGAAGTSAFNAIGGSMAGAVVQGELFVRGLTAALVTLRSFTSEAAIYAARTEQLGIAVDQLAKVNNLNIASVEGVADALTYQNITLQAARLNVSRMIEAQIDLTKATALVTVAQNASVIAGKSVDETLQLLIGGIVRQRTQILRQIGLQVNFNQAIEAYARSLGVGKDSLDEFTKKQIATDVVLVAGARIAGVYSQTLYTTYGQMQLLSKSTDDAKNAIGSALQPALLNVIQTLSSTAHFIQENASALATIAKIAVTAGAALSAFAVATRFGGSPLVGALAAGIALSVTKSQLFVSQAEAEKRVVEDAIVSLYKETDQIRLQLDPLGQKNVLLQSLNTQLQGLNNELDKLKGKEKDVLDDQSPFTTALNKAKEIFGSRGGPIGYVAGVLNDSFNDSALGQTLNGAASPSDESTRNGFNSLFRNRLRGGQAGQAPGFGLQVTPPPGEPDYSKAVEQARINRSAAEFLDRAQERELTGISKINAEIVKEVDQLTIKIDKQGRIYRATLSQSALDDIQAAKNVLISKLFEDQAKKRLEFLNSVAKEEIIQNKRRDDENEKQVKRDQEFDNRTQKIREETADRRLDYSITQAGGQRDVALRTLDQQVAYTTQQAVSLAEAKRGVELKFSREIEQLEIQRLQRQTEREVKETERSEKLRLAEEVRGTKEREDLFIQEQVLKAKVAYDSIAEKRPEDLLNFTNRFNALQARRAQAVQDAAEVQKKGDALIEANSIAIRADGEEKISEIVNDAAQQRRDINLKYQQEELDITRKHYIAIYDTIKSTVGSIFDDLFSKSKGFFQSLGDTIKKILLNTFKDIVSSQVSKSLTSLITGQPVSFQGGNAVEGTRVSGLGRILGRLGVGGVPTFGNGTANATQEVSYGSTVTTANGQRSGISIIQYGGPGGAAPSGSSGGFLRIIQGPAPVYSDPSGGGIINGGTGSGVLGTGIPGLNIDGGGFEGFPPFGNGASGFPNFGGLGTVFNTPSGGGSTSGGQSISLDSSGIPTFGGPSATGASSNTSGRGIAGLLGIFGKTAGGGGGIGGLFGIGKADKGGLPGGVDPDSGDPIAGTDLGSGTSLSSVAGSPIGQLAAGIGLSVGTGLFLKGIQNRGTAGGFFESVGGGALAGASLGTLIAPGIGTLIGAGIGAAVGIVTGLIGFAIPQFSQQVHDQIKSAYGLDVKDKGLLKSIGDTIKAKYGGSISIGIRSKEIVELLSLYAQTTGQNFPIRATAQPLLLQDVGGKLFQQPFLQNGQSIAYAGATPTITSADRVVSTGPGYNVNGTLGNSRIGGPTFLNLSLNGDSAMNALQGQTVSTINNNGDVVSNANYNATLRGNNRRATASAQFVPGLVTSS